ncbi:MAG: methionine synthase, partial [Mycobacterium sp.]|nr:methionine synthase [Mycobacterium sp.]
GISPACGLAGATEAWARQATGLTQRTAAAIAQDPAAI